MTQQQKIAAALRKARPNPGRLVRRRNNAIRAYRHYEPVKRKRSPSSNDFEPRPAVVLMKGENNPTFLISWRSQREIARWLGWKCTLMIWGGPSSPCSVSMACLLWRI